MIAALAMVVGVFAYRYGLPGTDSSPGGSTSSVLCASELGAACDAAGAKTVEPATAAAKRLLGAGTRAEVGGGWLSPGPWPAIVDEGRQLASRPALFAERRGVGVDHAGGGGP